MTVRIGNYPLDLALDESLSYTGSVTKNAIEKGGKFADNIDTELPVLTFHGVVSDTPIGAIATDPTRQNLTGAISADAFERMSKMFQDRQPLTVDCSWGKFELMAFTSLNPTRDAKSKNSFDFTATFEQMKIFENSRTTVPVSIPNGSGQVNFGLSVDNLTDGKRVLWRHGKPPGKAPFTIPTGIIFRVETLVVKKGKLFHDNKKQLTDAELKDFDLDLKRDQAVGDFKQSARNVVGTLDRLANGKSLSNPKQKPGKVVDRSLFGLK